MSEPSTPGPVLLCIDLQPVFLATVADRERLTRRCSFAIEAANGLGLKVAFSEQMPQKLGGSEASFLTLVDTPLQMGKASFSALADHGIRETLLDRLGADHLILLGVETSICVYQTAVDAIRSEIPVTLLSDCVGGRRPEDGSVALDALKRAGVNVLPAETVFYSMLGDAVHPFFRTYTQLVKKYS